MVCIIIDEKGKIRKFETMERAEKYIQRHDGIYFFIEPLNKYLGVSVINSRNGEIEKIKGFLISRNG